MSFTFTVPSKDQDSSLESFGELESREKHLTCSLWPCSTLHLPDCHSHNYGGQQQKNVFQPLCDRDIKNQFSPLVAIFAFPMYLMSNLIRDAFLKYLYMKEESNWSNSRELTEFKKHISN